VIIDDLDLFGALAPTKQTRHWSLILMRAAPRRSPFQRFEAIAGRGPQVGQLGGCVRHVEFAHRHPSDDLERSNGFAPIKCLGGPVRYGALGT